MSAPAPLPMQALKAEARRRGLQVVLGNTPGSMILIARYARDRNPHKFPNRDAAMSFLRTLPVCSNRR